jgi:hypothetical protein
MGKLSQHDADEMIRGYRARAIDVIKEIDRLGLGSAGTVREQILREVRARVQLEGKSPKKPADAKAAKAKAAEAKAAEANAAEGKTDARSDAQADAASDPAPAEVAASAADAARPIDDELDADSTTALEPRHEAKEARQ